MKGIILQLKKIIKEANQYCDVCKISNDCAENLNRKDKAFHMINDKLSKAITIVDSLGEKYLKE